MTKAFVGIDLSQSACGVVVIPVPFACEWDRVRRVTCGAKVGRDATPEQRADHLVKLGHNVLRWLREAAGPFTDVAFEGYPMGSGSLHAIDRVAEIGGVLRRDIRVAFGIAPTASPIASARKLFLGSLSHAHLAQCVRHMKPAEVRKLGKQKAAVWAESQRMRCGFKTPDEADAFVAANWAMHEAELPAVAGVGGMAA